MVILLSGPNKRLGFSDEIKKLLNKELKDCKSLVAIAASESSEKSHNILMVGKIRLEPKECLVD